MTNHYCVDQQILNWRYRSISRYQLSEAPVTVAKCFLLGQASSNITNFFNKSAFNFNNKNQKNRAFYDFTVSNKSLSLSAPSENQRSKGYQGNNTIAKVYLNHVQLWSRLKTITLHTTSGKLLSNIELYASSYMAFCCCGTQSPQIIRSKQAVAGFNVIKAAIIGTRSSLRSKNKLCFSYKWAYLIADLPFLGSSGKMLLKEKRIQSFQCCLGIQNVFTFPELDKYDYYLFEPITGFDLGFHYKGYWNCNKDKRQN